MIRKSMFAALAAFTAVMTILGGAATDAAAQAWPQKPVRIIVPSAAGGPTDIPARIVGDGLSRLMNARFVVENRVGAGGIIAAEAVARSAPDGYTLLFANTSVIAVNAAIYDKLPYDAASAFAAIGFVSNSPQVLVANPKLPFRTVKDMLAYAKANPGKLNFAAGGPGTLPHLTYELLKLETGLDALLVNYSGGGPALIAVMSGQADLQFDIVGSRVKSGEVRALAVTSASRHPEAPAVPTMAEIGLPGMTCTSGTGLVGPAGIPSEIVTLLNGRLNELLRMPEVAGKMRGLGLLTTGGSPEEFASWAAEQRSKWIRVVKASGAKIN